MAAIDGNPNTGWGMTNYGEPRNAFLLLRFADRLKTGTDSILTVHLRQDSSYRRATIGRFRLALASSDYAWLGREAIGAREPKPEEAALPEAFVKALRTPETERTYEQRKAVLDHFARTAPELQPAVLEIAKLEAEVSLLDASIPQIVVTETTEPAVTHLLARGNWMDDSGEIVQPAPPAFLGKFDTAGRATRLDLANWLVSPENPLTARVFVNRLWRQFFGTGLSKVLDDLGSQGEWPTHTELLDWMAAEFMQDWDVKHIIRTIVTSHTYRQSSASNPTLDSKDPDNRLLARQSRLRVDAEAVRDIALAVSGLLVEKFGGPSVKPWQPEGYLSALNFPKREWTASHGEDLYRRGVYTHWQRTFLHPSLLTFDAPTREECTVNRVSSNTPLQALVLLNDPVFVEAARVFAQHILESGGTKSSSRIDWAFDRALGRKPMPQEREILTQLYKRSLEQFRAAPREAEKLVHVGEAPLPSNVKTADLAAMTSVARAVLNLHETINRN
jgi:hypothetical protein